MAQALRIARSYLTELLSGDNDHETAEQIAEFLIAEASTVDHMPRRDRLVLTFDLPDENELPDDQVVKPTEQDLAAAAEAKAADPEAYLVAQHTAPPR